MYCHRLLIMIRSSHQRCSVKRVFLEILQNPQENTCARVSFLIKWQAPTEHVWAIASLWWIIEICKIYANIWFNIYILFIQEKSSPYVRRTLRSETFFRIWKSFKNDEKCFLFSFKSFCCSEGIWIFVLTLWSCRKTTWLER